MKMIPARPVLIPAALRKPALKHALYLSLLLFRAAAPAGFCEEPASGGSKAQSAEEAEAETLPAGRPGILTRNFGTNQHGLPALGDTYTGAGKIPARGNAALIFATKSDESASNIPNTLGNWLAIDTRDGLIEIFGKMDGGELLSKTIVKGGDTIGKTGKSGWSNAEGYYFSVYDRKERHWLNPALTEPPDTGEGVPVIKSVKLRGEGGESADLSRTQTIRQGLWSVEADAEIRNPRAAPLAPGKITTILNGLEENTLSLGTFTAIDGLLMAGENQPVPARQIYAPWPALEAAGKLRFNRGQALFEIIIQGAGDSVRTFRYLLFVN